MTAAQSFEDASQTYQLSVSPSTFSVQSFPVALSPAVAFRQEDPSQT